LLVDWLLRKPKGFKAIQTGDDISCFVWFDFPSLPWQPSVDASTLFTKVFVEQQQLVSPTSTLLPSSIHSSGFLTRLGVELFLLRLGKLRFGDLAGS
jgi:hypothetical protein